MQDATTAPSPRKREVSEWRAKSEFGLQFSPEPVYEPISLDRSGLGVGEGFRLIDAASMTVEINEKEGVVDIGETAILFLLVFANRNRARARARARWEGDSITSRSTSTITITGEPR